MAVLSGEGVKLSYSADGTGYVEIAQVVTMDGPNTNYAEVETTALDSTVREYRAGLKEAGTFSFEIQYDPDNTQHAAIEAADGGFFLEVDLNDDGTASEKFSFPCIKTAFSFGGFEVDSNVIASVDVRLTGDIS
ncbi:MAG: phage tail tube protein [Pirellulaceae bacterium]